jgi:RimJ/RimL family protein N-acetyltransferase
VSRVPRKNRREVPPFESGFPSVRLRFATESDAVLIHRWRGEDSVRRHQPLAPTTASQLRAELGVQRASLLRQSSGQKFQWIVEVDERPGGWITLVVHNWDHGLAEIGYALSTAFQGRGLMTIALGRFVDEIFDVTKLERLEARCAIDNLPSARVLERCRFEREGRLRGYFVLDGKRVDNYLYARLRRSRAD